MTARRNGKTAEEAKATIGEGDETGRPPRNIQKRRRDRKEAFTRKKAEDRKMKRGKEAESKGLKRNTSSVPRKESRNSSVASLRSGGHSSRN